MTIEPLLPNEPLFVGVEQSATASAAFYGKWLTNAAHAQELLVRMKRTNQAFEELVLRELQVVYDVDFGNVAMWFCSQLQTSPRVIIFVDDFETDMFCMMAGMHFFERNGVGYRPMQPPSLTAEAVQSAMVELLNTEEPERVVHPERVLQCMPHSQALKWQRELSTPVEG
jgi:hypothetical protein